jgi:hypothetical protein
VRILATADVHGCWPVYDWLLAAAREGAVDAIVLAGDFLGCLDGFDTPEDAQRHESELLATLLARAGVPQGQALQRGVGVSATGDDSQPRDHGTRSARRSKR